MSYNKCTLSSHVSGFAGAVSDMAALFTTEAQLRAWLLVPEHEIGNTGVTEPPLLKRAHEIMKKTAEGLVSPVLEGDRVRSSCKGSDKDSVYELSVHVRDKESIDCQCTCPFAKNPVSGEAGGRSDSVQECRCQRQQLTVPLLSLYALEFRRAYRCMQAYGSSALVAHTASACVCVATETTSGH